MDSNNNKKIGLLTELLAKLKELLSIKTKPTMPALYEEALKYLGNDASPKDLTSDNFGCAESVSNIISGLVRGFPIVTGTWSLYDMLRLSMRFMKVPDSQEPLPGDVIVCVTGQGKGTVSNGHVGIVGLEGVIMSNDSKTGKFEANYTFKTWDDRYVKQGKYPVHIFRFI